MGGLAVQHPDFTLLHTLRLTLRVLGLVGDMVMGGSQYRTLVCTLGVQPGYDFENGGVHMEYIRLHMRYIEYK